MKTSIWARICAGLGSIAVTHAIVASLAEYGLPAGQSSSERLTSTANGLALAADRSRAPGIETPHVLGQATPVEAKGRTLVGNKSKKDYPEP